MRPQMKRPILEGFGHRNNTVEAIRTDRVLRQAASELETKAARARPQTAPTDPGQRQLNYTASGRPLTPAQRRRAEKKEWRAWSNPGLGGLLTAADEHEQKMLEPREDDGPELPPWDPAECSCHINPPCTYCERGEYVL